MCPFAQLVQSLGLVCYQYANGTQLYLLLGGYLDTVLANLAGGVEAIVVWLKKDRLRLNPIKMEALWLAGGSGWGDKLPTLYRMPLISVQSLFGYVPEPLLE